MAVVIFRSFLCLLLLGYYVSSLEIRRDSGEDSEESLESLEINTEVKEREEGAGRCLGYESHAQTDICWVGVCTDQCSLTNYNTDEKNLCKFGCKFMMNVFNNVKTKFSKTKPEYLLGNALDQCWQGCEENYSVEVSCYAGCNNMNKLQKQRIKTEHSENIDTSSTEETSNWYIRAQEKEGQEKKDRGDDESAGEQIPVVRTFVLWRPNSADLEGVYSSYNTMVNIMQEMFGDIVTAGEEVERGGYKDDRMQLAVPHYQGYAALTSEEESQTEKAKKALDNLYQKIRGSFDEVALNIRNTLQSPRYKELIFYALMTICCFLILTAIYDIFCENRKQNSEDHYHLEDTAIKAKLPTYEECMSHDPVKQKLAVQLEHENENEKKCDDINI